MTIITRRGLAGTALGGLALGAGLSAGSTAHAQDFPRRGPIRILVPQAAGSATDVMSRALAAGMSAVLGQQFVIDNRPGAGGIRGAELLAKAEPDGYTLGIANISTHAVNPGLYRNLPYDPIKDFTPISLSALIGNAVIVHDALPARTLAEFIEYARRNPGKVSYASAGQGSSQQLVAELLASMAGGLKMLHVPYRGTGPGVIAVMTGEVDMMIPTIASALPGVQSGRARALAVTTEAPVKDLPDVPIAAATLPGYVVTSWYGLAGPAGLPAPIVARLGEAVATAVKRPDTVRPMVAAGFEPVSGTPDAFTAYIRDEIARWKQVITDAGIKIES